MIPIFDCLASGACRIGASQWSAAWFLVFAAPISAYVTWTDFRWNRIPNRTVLLLAGCFVVVGLIALPFETYLWRLLQGVIVLAVGFVLNQFGGIGAGDVKFAAAAAPLVAPADAQLVMLLFASVLLASFFTHRLFRAIPSVRRATPDWTSWGRKDFPMGFALGGALVFYLLLALRFGS
jgi:prepilin peptidase CpaA